MEGALQGAEGIGSPYAGSTLRQEPSQIWSV